MKKRATYFGYETVSEEVKTRRVEALFSSVASHYDLMNDLMSFGLHRLWKRQLAAACLCRPGARIMDLASGTGDMASLLYDRMKGEKYIVICDRNNDMLQSARARMLDEGKVQGVGFVRADAEYLPFTKDTFDCIVVAFGLRNFTDMARAMRAMCARLKYGGRLLILELTRPVGPLLDSVYKTWSFAVVPRLGKWVAGDAASYRYLVESVRRHPDQETLSAMLGEAGFGKVDYVNLCGGVVAIHTAYKL